MRAPPHVFVTPPSRLHFERCTKMALERPFPTFSSKSSVAGAGNIRQGASSPSEFADSRMRDSLGHGVIQHSNKISFQGRCADQITQITAAALQQVRHN